MTTPVHRSFRLTPERTSSRSRWRWPSRLRYSLGAAKLAAAVALLSSILGVGYLFGVAKGLDGIHRLLCACGIVLYPFVVTSLAYFGTLRCAVLFRVITSEESRRLRHHVLRGRRITPKLARFGWCLAFVGFANFFSLIALGLYAATGEEVDQELPGHFYHHDHGHTFEVSATFNQVQRIQVPSIMVTHPLAILGLWLTQGCPWPKRRRRQKHDSSP